MRVDLGIMAGEESKKCLVNLGEITERLEKVARALRSPGELEEAETVDAEDDEEIEVKAKPAAKRGRPAKAVVEFEEEQTEDDDETAFGEEVVAPKAAKKKKLSLEDLNKACKDRAAKTGFKEVMALLKKNFSVEESVKEIDESDYAAVIELLQTAKLPKSVK